MPLSDTFLKHHNWTYPNDLKKGDVKNFLERTQGKESKIISIDPKTKPSVLNPLDGLDSSNSEYLKLKKDYLKMVKEMNS